MRSSLFTWLCAGPFALVAVAFAWACWSIWRYNRRVARLSEYEQSLDPDCEADADPDLNLEPDHEDFLAAAAEERYLAAIELLAARYALDTEYVLG